MTILVLFVSPSHCHPCNSPVRNPVSLVEKLVFRNVKFHTQDCVDRKWQRGNQTEVYLVLNPTLSPPADTVAVGCY